MDIFPGADDAAAAPLAMFIHGGWWRSLAPSMFSQLAAGPNKHGITVAMAGYDLCPQVSIPTIIEQMRAACLWLWRKYRKRIMVYGHSAGGHLAACMVATDWKTLDPERAGRSGAGGLTRFPACSIWRRCCRSRSTRTSSWTRRRRMPARRSIGRCRPDASLDAVVGSLESSEFLRQSKTIAEAWRQGPTQTRYEEIAGANHFTAVDPLSDGNSAMSKRVAELARGVAAVTL